MATNATDTVDAVAVVDVCIAWLNVHGGSFHKLLRLLRELKQDGLSARLYLSSDPPLGLQPGVDITPETVRELAGQDVFVLGRAAIEAELAARPARLFLFDAHVDEGVRDLINQVRARHGAKTGQLCTLFADYTHLGSDYPFVQSPQALWYALEYRRERRKRRQEFVAHARDVLFAGNIFYEPEPNTVTSEVRTREELFRKYGLDPAKPLCLWLPAREDGLCPSYLQVLEAVRGAGMNVAVKLHPWEYKQLAHGFDPFGQGMTSAQKWGVAALDERDASLAYAVCDAGIMRESSVGLELACAGKPSIYFPASARHQHWLDIYFDFARSCSVRLPSVEALGPLLARGIPRFSSGDYAEARRRILALPDGEDSFQAHVRLIRGVLDRPRNEPPLGSLRALRRYYAGRMPLRLVNPLRHPLFAADTALRAACRWLMGKGGAA